MIPVTFIAAGFFGITSIVLFLQWIEYRKCGLNVLKGAIKKGRPIIFLEGPTHNILRIPENQIENVAFTKEKDIITISAGTTKPCPQLGNALIAHGDLYMSHTIPVDMYNLVQMLKTKGKTTEQIAVYIDKLQNANEDSITALLEELKSKDGVEVQKIPGVRYNLWNTISLDTIKNYLNTGLNRTMIKKLLQTLIEQNRLDKMFGGRNWLPILIGIAVVLLLGAFALKIMASGGVFESLAGAFGGGAGVAQNLAPQITP